MPNKFDREMQKIFEECQRWLAYPQHMSRFEESRTLLQAYLVHSSELSSKEYYHLKWLGHHWETAACEAYGRQDIPALAVHINACVSYRALVLRLEAAFSAMTPEEAGGRPASFNDSMKAAGPAMLGQWGEAKLCAQSFVGIAEKDQRLRIRESRRLRHGTVDAFLISLFSEAFSIETVFQSLKPIHSVYSKLLQCWNSENDQEFVTAMQAAAEFHISRSRNSTNSASYEFDDYFSRVFPVELLMVQALRQRDNLPAIEVGHPLVDETWATLIQLPGVPEDPLLLAIETRLKTDFPMFLQFSIRN